MAKKSEGLLKKAFNALKGASAPINNDFVPEGQSISGFQSGEPKMAHYEGPLGIFDYDSSQWEIKTHPGPNGPESRFMYKGYETDGSKIHIPNGVKDLSWTFSGRVRERAINPAPVIPYGVERCDYTFAVSDLKVAPEFPDTVKFMRYTFDGCYNLEKTFDSLPPSVEDITGLHGGCSKLRNCDFEIHRNVKYCSGLLAGCSSVQTTPSRIPDTVEKCSGFCNGCSSLEKLGNPKHGYVTDSSFYSKNAESFAHMFHGCRSLREIPPLPRDGKVTDVDYMCASCTSIETPVALPNSVTSCFRAYAYCTGLKFTVPIPENAGPGHFGEMYLYSSVEDEGKRLVSDHIAGLKAKGFYKDMVATSRKNIDTSLIQQADMSEKSDELSQ